MWIKGNYRRNLLDMHIADWNPEFLSKVDPKEYVDCLKEAGFQAAMVKAMPHTGLCNYPTKRGVMHRGLKGRDFFGEVVDECHKNGISVIAYYSQVFDNEAYDKHPSWRTVAADGKKQKEFRNQDCFRNGRYGIVCPNNPEYRSYVKANLEELNEMYSFEGMFLDMTFWPEVCYCKCCSDRYQSETGRELPRIIDWQDENFREWQRCRERWLGEFAAFTTKVIKDVHPDCTIEHQMSMVACSWIHACSEDIANQVDYTGGDYYGGFLQQTFINKYFKNISPNLPFVYHTSRCDPALDYHTTTKSRDELLLHVITALVHNGAFLLVDAINPDGTIVPDVYRKLMKSIYDETKGMEPYVTGDLISNVGIWFATHSKFDPNETNIPMMEKSFGPRFFMEAPVKMASILREENVPFDVIGSKNIADYKGKCIAICHVSQILDDEMDALERFVKQGGNLYVSGPIGHPRLAELLGVEFTGVCSNPQTVESFTYLDPTDEGKAYFEGFDALAPLSVPMSQYEVKLTTAGAKVLATKTLPYTIPNTPEFAAIHSNPPGIHTGEPACILREVGAGKLLYVAAPIEMSRPFMSRRVVAKMLRSLAGELLVESNAPKMLETLSWKKEGKLYVAFLNEQEESPVIPVANVSVMIHEDGYRTARSLTSGKEVANESGEGAFSFTLPSVGVFEIVELSK